MSSPSPGYAIRVLLRWLQRLPRLVPAVASVGAEIATLDVVDSTHKNVVVAITCNTSGMSTAGVAESVASKRLWPRRFTKARVVTPLDPGAHKKHECAYSAHLIHS